MQKEKLDAVKGKTIDQIDYYLDSEGENNWVLFEFQDGSTLTITAETIRPNACWLDITSS